MPKNTTAAQCWESGSSFHTVWVGFDTCNPPQLYQGFAGVRIPCQNDSMEIGYAPVSRGDSQDLDPQLRTLRDAGCNPIYQTLLHEGCPGFTSRVQRHS